jgi:hypothetical protein
VRLPDPPSRATLALQRAAARFLRTPPRLGLAVAALAAEVTIHLLNFRLGDSRVRLLDSASGWSYPHHVSTLAYAGGALACVAGARSAAGEGMRPAWLLAAGLFGLLLLDHVTRLHNSIPAWPVVYAPLLLALAGAIVAIAAGTELAPYVYAALGLLCASVAGHALGPALTDVLGWTSEAWAYQVKVALKEGLELAGWVLLVPALYALAVRRDGWAGVARAEA